MERFMADTAVKEAAKADSVQSCQGLFGTAFVQLHTIGIAVVSLGKLPQGLTAATARVDQIGGHALRKLDTL